MCPTSVGCAACLQAAPGSVPEQRRLAQSRCIADQPGPLTAGVHGGHRLFTAHLHHHAALIVAARQRQPVVVSDQKVMRQSRPAPLQLGARTAAAPLSQARFQPRLRATATESSPFTYHTAHKLSSAGPACSLPHAPCRMLLATTEASPDSHGVGALDVAHRPHALHAVVQRVLQPVAAVNGEAARMICKPSIDVHELHGAVLHHTCTRRRRHGALVERQDNSAAHVVECHSLIVPSTHSHSTQGYPTAQACVHQTLTWWSATASRCRPRSRSG